MTLILTFVKEYILLHLQYIQSYYKYIDIVIKKVKMDRNLYN